MLQSIYWKNSSKSNTVEKYPEVKIFYLPTYSPEYNPIEQVWKWIKPLVHAAETIAGGIQELINRFRKILHAKINFHNKVFVSMDAVDDQLEEGLRNMAIDKARVRSFSAFSWMNL